ncbi:MAG TPA: SRPBCC family protein [Chitinophagaceae bacterium]|nr:SRPBCC family protein [Chitinophagaceae bacterium]
MNILIITLAVPAILIVLSMVLALFLRKDFTVERTITINKPKQDVFEFIRFLENHRAFSKWTTKESNKVKPGTGTDGQPGFVLAWDNFKEKAGTGELEIRKITNGSGIDIEHRYIKPLKGLANTYITVSDSSSNQTELRWVYSGVSTYPVNLLTSILNMDNIVGRDLETCLTKLKTKLENSQNS